MTNGAVAAASCSEMRSRPTLFPSKGRSSSGRKRQRAPPLPTTPPKRFLLCNHSNVLVPLLVLLDTVAKSAVAAAIFLDHGNDALVQQNFTILLLVFLFISKDVIVQKRRIFQVIEDSAMTSRLQQQLCIDNDTLYHEHSQRHDKRQWKRMVACRQVHKAQISARKLFLSLLVLLLNCGRNADAFGCPAIIKGLPPSTTIRQISARDTIHKQLSRRQSRSNNRNIFGALHATQEQSQEYNDNSTDDSKNQQQQQQQHLNNLQTQQLISRKRQQRRKPRNRRPRNYWTNPKNILKEIKDFWADCGLDPSVYNNKNHPVMIPNEIILMYYGRHDLRAALSSAGGRDVVAEMLGNVCIMPGRWSEAVQEPQIQALLKVDKTLSPHQSPSGTFATTTTTTTQQQQLDNKWSHKEDRNPKGYWNLTRVIEELYEYVDGVRGEHGRPAAWMPRPNEMTASGRDDLRQAIQRFGGSKRICKLAGMVPFREWYFFEGQLELLVSLKDYIDEFEQSDYSTFPIASEIRRNGYGQLYSLIQYYGGRKYLAHRLGMTSGSSLPTDDFVGANWGPFDLLFAIGLLNFVRDDHLRRRPPLRTPLLVMPRRERLMAEESWLHDRVERYGGYENVARRLGLAFFQQPGQ